MWSITKPDFKRECLCITASKVGGQWEYKTWVIKLLECDEQWYLGLLTGDLEEWGDIDDLKADLYNVMPLLK